jgi:hypothetical protein
MIKWVIVATLAIATTVMTAQTRGRDQAIAWLHEAAAAMGGEATLRAVEASTISGVAVSYQREQSERPEGPWVATYSDFTDVRIFATRTVRRTARVRGYSTPDWVDNADWTADTTTLIVDGLGLHKVNERWLPAETPWDLGLMPVELGPEHLILAALDASDCRVEPDVTLHGHPHHVVSFTARGAVVRILLNAPAMLPKAVEITRARPYDTYWAPWGDVIQRVTFGVWTLEPNGLRFPRLWEYSTGGQPDGRIDITRVRLNPGPAPADVSVPDDVRQSLVVNRSRVSDAALGDPRRPAAELAPGVVKVPGRWDVVEVKQDDGVLILEGPLTSSYSTKVIEDAQHRFGGTVIKGVISTSDAWPHLGGLREYAARGVPIYALDLNLPIIQRLLDARYPTDPDRLARQPKAPRFRIVAAKTVVGQGASRLEIYPLRTVTGERQMMIYWPAYQLLYTSDLFTLLPTGDVFLPQQVSELVDAVARERLTVRQAFGMHYDVVPWDTVVASARPPR